MCVFVWVDVGVCNLCVSVYVSVYVLVCVCISAYVRARACVCVCVLAGCWWPRVGKVFEESSWWNYFSFALGLPPPPLPSPHILPRPPHFSSHLCLLLCFVCSDVVTTRKKHCKENGERKDRLLLSVRRFFLSPFWFVWLVEAELHCLPFKLLCFVSWLCCLSRDRFLIEDCW